MFDVHDLNKYIMKVKKKTTERINSFIQKNSIKILSSSLLLLHALNQASEIRLYEN